MLDRVGHRARGLSARLTASYILVTLTAVVLVEAITLGFQVPSLVNGAQLQAQVAAAAKSFGQQFARRYPRGIPAGTVLGDPGQPAKLGMVRPTPDGTLVFPAITGPIPRKQGVTAVVAIATDGTVVASSVPARYRPGRAAASELPVQAAQAITGPHLRLKGGGVPTRYGNVIFWIFGPEGHAEPGGPPTSVPGLADYVYVQAPWSPPGFINPVHAWDELRQLGEDGPLLVASYALLLAIVPVGVLFGLLASWRLVRRVRRLERATLAVADGDYTVSLPASGRDEIGRLEANFTTMTRQLGSALAAERQRATSDARAAERARIAREVHDAISQHLFGLRMIAAGMRRADPGNQQARVIERISEEALRDMQTLLIELRPDSLAGAGLAPALREICAAYRDRLGVTVDASLDDVTVPAPIEHALLRITQEACTNAVRHGNARQLAVSMTRSDGHVELAVRDDLGTGFDPGPPRHAGYRAVTTSGTGSPNSAAPWTSTAAPGRGAALTVRVPGGGAVTIRVVIADDHHVVREGLCYLLGQEPDRRGGRHEALETGRQAVERRRRHPPRRATAPSTCTCPGWTVTPCSPHCTMRRTGLPSSCSPRPPTTSTSSAPCTPARPPTCSRPPPPGMSSPPSATRPPARPASAPSC